MDDLSNRCGKGAEVKKLILLSLPRRNVIMLQGYRKMCACAEASDFRLQSSKMFLRKF